MYDYRRPAALLIASLIFSQASSSSHLVAQSSLPAQAPEVEAASAPTTRPASALDKRLAAFSEEDTLNPHAPGGVLFVGSSIFDNWKTVAQDMAPLPVLNRAIGGTVTGQQVQHVRQLTLKYEPRVIVYYCGSNDINNGLTAEAIFHNFRAYVDAVAAQLPETKVIFVSINRAPQKRPLWNVVDEANASIKAYAANSNRVVFVDVNPALFDANGDPRVDLYLADQLHFKPAAYEEFTRIIKPVLQDVWKQVNKTESGQ